MYVIYQSYSEVHYIDFLQGHNDDPFTIVKSELSFMLHNFLINSLNSFMKLK